MADDQWGAVNVLLNCGAPVKRSLQDLWPHLPNLEWLHSSAAGVEHILFPDLVEGPVTLTNAKVGGTPSSTSAARAACLIPACPFIHVSRCPCCRMPLLSALCAAQMV
jgi:hypothetical protein